MWRRRWWLAYLAEVIGAICIAAGWVLKGSASAVAINVAWAVGFGIAFPLFAGRQKRWWVVVGTSLVITLVVGALGYGLVRSRFRKTKAAQATVGKAVADFRRARGALLAAERGRVPLSGVYKYAATGYYEIGLPALGKDRRVLPKAVPAVLAPSGNCWELSVRYFKQHHWTVRYCRDPRAGLRMVWLRNTNEFFGMKTWSQYRCDPDVILRPGDQPGRQWQQLCKPQEPKPVFGSAQVKVAVRYVGTESMTIGGRTLKAHHLHRTINMTGIQVSVIEQDLWYAAESGMMVRLHLKGQGSGIAKFDSDYQLTLKSLSPKR
jgi:uncharacterized protein YneR